MIPPVHLIQCGRVDNPPFRTPHSGDLCSEHHPIVIQSSTVACQDAPNASLASRDQGEGRPRLSKYEKLTLKRQGRLTCFDPGGRQLKSPLGDGGIEIRGSTLLLEEMERKEEWFQDRPDQPGTREGKDCDGRGSPDHQPSRQTDIQA